MKLWTKRKEKFVPGCCIGNCDSSKKECSKHCKIYGECSFASEDQSVLSGMFIDSAELVKSAVFKTQREMVSSIGGNLETVLEVLQNHFPEVRTRREAGKVKCFVNDDMVASFCVDRRVSVVLCIGNNRFRHFVKKCNHDPADLFVRASRFVDENI